MSDGPVDTLAPPSNPSRPSSANSTRSNSSRRGRPGTKSGNASRSASNSSRGTSNGGKKTSGATTTISGGTSLGIKEKSGDEEATTSGNRKPNGKSQGRGGAQGAKKDTRKPSPISINAPSRPASQNSTKDRDSADTAPRSLHVSSVPRTAMEAAFDAAHKKHEDNGGDALTSLQKMISDLKSISPSSTTPPQSSTSGRRSVSAPKEEKPPQPAVAIPSIAAKKLKADAPSFTPSSVSPGASGFPISPSNAIPQPRSASQGAAPRRASSSSATLPFVPLSATSPPSAYNTLPHFPLANPSFPGQLPELQEEVAAPFMDTAYQQQLLAAQYQQIQLLQAQIAANQLAQQQSQQHQQQQSMGSFMAPRFQALAAQRAQQQRDQTAQLYQAHAQAQQMFQLNQQQLLQQEAQAKAIAQATLRDPPEVFEEDSPESRPATLGPTGRPQLNPGFTFGAKKRQESVSEAISPPQPPIINRSEGIGGAAATGLAGLAARAHKRTNSELTSAMREQLEIQEQIEALQAKQKALLQEEADASPLGQLNHALKQTPSQTLNQHRRAQSSFSAAHDSSQALEAALEASQPRQVIKGFGEMPPPPVPSSHSRRHSVNVFNKTAGTGSGFGSMSSDIPEDGFGHHRSGSRSGFESGNWRSVVQGPTADLASAQAQLQSLAQFRAAAGGGHAKMASFAFPNMLPNLLAATTLQAPAGQSLFQQQQAFQMQLQQNSQGPQRKSLFAPYLPQASLPPLLSAGKLVVGILRVNKKNRSDAYVATDVLEADIYICGSKDRNRALEGDIVAVELLDVDEVWSTKKDKEEKKRKKEENAAYDLKPSQAKKLEKKKDDVEVEGQGLTLFDDEEVNDDTKPTYAGHVVAVVERMPGQLFSGQLGVLRPSSAATKEKQELERREREGDRAKKEEPEARPKIVWFKPTDKRVPLIAIPTEQAPADFIDNPDAYSERLFVATIKRWPITSLHPFGTLVEELGPIGDTEVETSALLKDCNFPTEEFADLAIKCLPPLPWTVPEREYEIRQDFRRDRVFTVDPPTAKDLDDALSVKKNDNGTYTVGVHIADVSYFVKSNTALDREARKRATSVYLVQRAVPMLPPQLAEELCSLVPGVERLTFSALFTLDEDANVIDKKFYRSIIKSCAKLAYQDVQGVLNGDALPASKIAGEVQADDIQGDISALHTLAAKLREKRVNGGAIVTNKLKVSFELDEQGRPVDVETYRSSPANTLVEEFMLLANTAVSQVIAHGLPEQALLRRHEAPIDRRLDGFVKRAKKLGFEMDPTSAGTLQKSFDKVHDQDEAVCLELLKRKAMQTAKYFCTGMLDIAKYSHWALNVPLYTHFTSPIRRYADVLVHRMLDACITAPNPNDVKFHMDRDQVAKCAQQCNMKKQSAKLAEEQSIHLYLCMLIHDLTERYGPVVREARVTGVLDAAFDVFIPEFGVEKRVHVDKMPVDNSVFDEHKDILSLYWTKKDIISHLAETSEDAHLQKLKASAARNGKKGGSGSRASKQYEKSESDNMSNYSYTGLRKSGDHLIQDIKELMALPVVVTADMTKSPPVLVVYACNPYAA